MRAGLGLRGWERQRRVGLLGGRSWDFEVGRALFPDSDPVKPGRLSPTYRIYHLLVLETCCCAIGTRE